MSNKNDNGHQSGDQNDGIGFLKLKFKPHVRKYSTRSQVWEGNIISIQHPTKNRRVRVRQKFDNIYSDGENVLVDSNSGALITRLIFGVQTGDVNTAPEGFRVVSANEFFENFYQPKFAFEQRTFSVPETDEALKWELFYTNPTCTEGVGIAQSQSVTSDVFYGYFSNN